MNDEYIEIIDQGRDDDDDVPEIGGYVRSSLQE